MSHSHPFLAGDGQQKDVFPQTRAPKWVQGAERRRSSASGPLADRLIVWHDEMVAHERRLRTSQMEDICDEDCPHSEAGVLWEAALKAFGARAHELTFLRSRATTNGVGL